MTRSFRTILLGATLCVLPLSACFCGEPPSEDAGPGDGGEGEGEGECGFVGVACSDDAECCGTLTCNATGFCGQPPACTDDDELAGTTTAPVAIGDISATAELHACNNELSNVDVFSIDATEGDLLKLVVTTLGVDPNGQVGGGQPDIDLWLFAEPPTGLQQTQDGGWVPSGGTLVSQDGGTVNATERILFEVPTGATGTYYAVVMLYSGPEGDYNLFFDKTASCEVDADCGAGFDFCRIDVDEEFVSVLQQCGNWTAPGCGDGADEAGGDVHSDANAVALTDTATGLICQDDIDVFTFDKPTGTSAFLTFTVADLGDDILVMTLIDPEGELFNVATVDEATGTALVVAPATARPGTWRLYLDQFGTPGTDEGSYTIDLDIRQACRTDADCTTAGEVCGLSLEGSGLNQVCNTPVADACGVTDGDDSATDAQLLADGTNIDASLCMGALDWFRVPVEGAVNNVTVNITWTGDADIDLYAVLGDGTLAGAGWYGTNGEQWRGNSLPAGDIYFAVDVFSCGQTACDTSWDYNIEAIVASGSPCTTDNGCVVGGTAAIQGASDPEVGLSCLSRPVGGGGDVDAGPGEVDAGQQTVDAGQQAGDAGATDGGATDGGATDGGGTTDAGTTPMDAGQTPVDAGGGTPAMANVCVRPVAISTFGYAVGEACFDNIDCSGRICLDDVCTSECSDDGACSGLGNGAYCFDLSDPGLCLNACTGDADCQAVFGADTPLVCFQGECALPN